jgi:hypothetical protein
MKIIGFDLSKILVQKKESAQGKIEVNQNIDIKDIKKDKIPISDDEVLKIEFSLQIEYSGDLAKLEFAGSLIIIPDKEESKEILKSWKDKKIPDKMRIPIFNFIMSKCNVKALSLEDDLNLPYHVPMPRLEPQKE